ncbi:MAG: hypothetical protein AAF789_13905, partial [Bacteroidota bacterium]
SITFSKTLNQNSHKNNLEVSIKNKSKNKEIPCLKNVNRTHNNNFYDINIKTKLIDHPHYLNQKQKDKQETDYKQEDMNIQIKKSIPGEEISLELLIGVLLIL